MAEQANGQRELTAEERRSELNAERIRTYTANVPAEYREEIRAILREQVERTNYDFVGSQRRLEILLQSIDRMRQRMERLLNQLSRRYPEHRLRFSGEN